MREVISCSRRTDIPSCHYEWLQERLVDGQVALTNPYNGNAYVTSLKPEDVHSIVLWSKNYQNVIADPGKLVDYNLYFHFTINGYSKLLEPGIPDPTVLIFQMKSLCEKYSPEQIMWRFDPIIISEAAELSRGPDARKEAFLHFCQSFSTFGIKNCTISFIDMYYKVKTAFTFAGFEHKELSTEEQVAYAKDLVSIANKYGIQLHTCSEPLIENVEGIQRGHCVDGARLTKLFGTIAINAKDRSQRPACGCSASKDIGDYKMGCPHGCLYCYAIQPKRY